MNISLAGVQQIKDFEGLKLKAYPCSTGKWTIGYGHTKGVKEGEVITLEEADTFLREDIHFICAQLNDLIKVVVTQNEFDALCSLVFNIGVKAFSLSTLLKKLNQGDKRGAAAEFPKWRYATVKGKKVALPSLIKRRQKEKTRFEIG